MAKKTVIIDGVEYAPKVSGCKYTDVYLVIDRSGSMSSIVNETISTINAQIEEAVKNKSTDDHKQTLSITLFNDKVTRPYWNLEDASVASSFGDKYVPEGYTAMFDAVGETLEAAQDRVRSIKEAHPDANIGVLMVIISDGCENASKTYTAERIASIVKESEQSGIFTFSYLGANQDLSEVSKMTGLTTTGYNATAKGMTANTNALRGTTQRYRAYRVDGANMGSNVFATNLVAEIEKETEALDKT